MTKQEVLDAINATIVANGQKGITAESLNNILTEMVNAAGEGGSGALRIMMPDSVLKEYYRTFAASVTPDIFSAAVIDAFLETYEAYMPGLTAAMRPVYDEALAHNAEVYQTIMSKASNQEGTLVLADASKTESAFMNFSYSLEGEAGTYMNVSFATPVKLMAIESNIQEETVIIFKLLAHEDIQMSSGLSTLGEFELHSDGHLSFKPTSNVLYFPQVGVTLSEEKSSISNDTLMNLDTGFIFIKDVTEVYSVDSSDNDTQSDGLISWSPTKRSFRYFLGNNIYESYVDAGTWVTILIGSLTTA